MINNDQTGEKRKLIGDPSCDVNFYFKKKPKFVFDQKNMINNPMNMNQMGVFHMLQAYQNKLQDNSNNNQGFNNQNANFNNFPPNFQNNFRLPLNNNMIPNLNNNNNNNIRFPIPTQNPNPVMFNIFNIKGGQNPFPHNSQNLLRLPFNNMNTNQLHRMPFNNNILSGGRMISNLPSNNNISSNNNPCNTNVTSDQLEDIISKLLTQQNNNKNNNANNVINNTNSQDKKNDTYENSIQEVKGVFEEEYSLEEENLKNLWSGYY